MAQTTFKQAISGVTPAETREVTIMTVWPSIAAYIQGQLLAQYVYSIRWPDYHCVRLGNLLAFLSIPHALALYFFKLFPSFFGSSIHGSAYKLTNRRIIEIRNEFVSSSVSPYFKFNFGAEVKSVELDRFDSVVVEQLPGQEWYDAADLVFRLGPVETFRLKGVSRPEAFRQTCLKAHFAYIGVKKIQRLQASMV